MPSRLLRRADLRRRLPILLDAAFRHTPAIVYPVPPLLLRFAVIYREAFVIFALCRRDALSDASAELVTDAAEQLRQHYAISAPDASLSPQIGRRAAEQPAPIALLPPRLRRHCH